MPSRNARSRAFVGRVDAGDASPRVTAAAPAARRPPESRSPPTPGAAPGGVLPGLLDERGPHLGQPGRSSVVRRSARQAVPAHLPDRVVVEGHARDAAAGEPGESLALGRVFDPLPRPAPRTRRPGRAGRTAPPGSAHRIVGNWRSVPVATSKQDRPGRRLFERLEEAVRRFRVEVVGVLDDAHDPRRREPACAAQPRRSPHLVDGQFVLPLGGAECGKSGCVPASTWAHAGQESHAVSWAGGRSQRIALASSRANSRLPTPSGPTSRYALAEPPADERGPERLLGVGVPANAIPGHTGLLAGQRPATDFLVAFFIRMRGSPPRRLALPTHPQAHHDQHIGLHSRPVPPPAGSRSRTDTSHVPSERLLDDLDLRPNDRVVELGVAPAGSPTPGPPARPRGERRRGRFVGGDAGPRGEATRGWRTIPPQFVTADVARARAVARRGRRGRRACGVAPRPGRGGVGRPAPRHAPTRHAVGFIEPDFRTPLAGWPTGKRPTRPELAPFECGPPDQQPIRWPNFAVPSARAWPGDDGRRVSGAGLASTLARVRSDAEIIENMVMFYDEVRPIGTVRRHDAGTDRGAAAAPPRGLPAGPHRPCGASTASSARCDATHRPVGLGRWMKPFGPMRGSSSVMASRSARGSSAPRSSNRGRRPGPCAAPRSGGKPAAPGGGGQDQGGEKQRPAHDALLHTGRGLRPTPIIVAQGRGALYRRTRTRRPAPPLPPPVRHNLTPRQTLRGAGSPHRTPDLPPSAFRQPIGHLRLGVGLHPTAGFALMAATKLRSARPRVPGRHLRRHADVVRRPHRGTPHPDDRGPSSGSCSSWSSGSSSTASARPSATPNIGVGKPMLKVITDPVE